MKTLQETVEYQNHIVNFAELHKKIQLSDLLASMKKTNEERAESAQERYKPASEKRDVSIARLKKILNILSGTHVLHQTLFVKLPEAEKKEKIDKLAIYAAWFEFNEIDDEYKKHNKSLLSFFGGNDKLKSVTYKSLGKALGIVKNVTYEGKDSYVIIEENKPNLEMQSIIYDELKEFIKKLIFIDGKMENGFHSVEYEVFSREESKILLDTLCTYASETEEQYCKYTFETAARKLRDAFETAEKDRKCAFETEKISIEKAYLEAKRLDELSKEFGAALPR